MRNSSLMSIGGALLAGSGLALSGASSGLSQADLRGRTSARANKYKPRTGAKQKAKAARLAAKIKDQPDEK